MQRIASSKVCRRAAGALIGLGIAVWCVHDARAAGLPGKWVEVRTPHFVVLSNAGQRSARDIAKHFEQIREIFIQALPGRIAESGRPLRVFAVSGERTMKRLLPASFERKGGARPAGAFRSTLTSSQVVVRADLLGGGNYRTVYHEYFHFLADGTRLKIPLWINEGLASYWGSTRLTPKAAEVGRPDSARLQNLQDGQFLPLEELMAVDHSSPHYSRNGKAQKFYAQSWALTHYLLVGDRSGKGREQLLDYLRRIADGEPGQDAAQVFGDLKDLKFRLRAYTRKFLLPYVQMAPPAQLTAEQLQIRELPRAEAAALAALFLLEGRRTDGAEDLVAAALEGAPDLVETQVGAGLMHALTGEYEEAEQAFERAVQLKGAGALAHYGLAVARFNLDLTPASLSAVAQHLAQAINLDPEFAPAKARLAEVARRNGDCSQPALLHIRGARAIEPQFPSYSLKEAQILLECGQADAARALVRQVVEEAADSESASDNNTICWDGSLWGLAREVLPACERGVSLSPENYAILDSRGVARAITGDLEGAAADLRLALELAGDDGWDEETAAQRKAWVRGLESGENPFAGDGLVKFRDDPAEVGLEWGQ